jgi:nucleoside-diphosphate-sugar epimerase
MAKIEKKRVSILGCGWLGFPLAQRLLTQNISSDVKGSTTSASKASLFTEEGITPYQFALAPDFTCEPAEVTSFLNADVLVIAIPPKIASTGNDFHVQQINAVMHGLAKSPINEVIYISSTGIYPDLNRIVVEEDVTKPEHSAAPAMTQAENILISLRPQKTVSILRLGGLLGYNRIPGKYVRGKKDMPTGSIPVNYIHRDDAVGIIAHIIDAGIINETFNVVAPLHPTRREVYLASCEQFSWESPTFSEPQTRPDYKVISMDKLVSHYAYDFKYPNPIQFYYESDE